MSDKEPPLHPAAVMRAWELDEANLRKADLEYERRQERAEMAIMLGKDYDMDGRNK